VVAEVFEIIQVKVVVIGCLEARHGVKVNPVPCGEAVPVVPNDPVARGGELFEVAAQVGGVVGADGRVAFRQVHAVGLAAQALPEVVRFKKEEGIVDGVEADEGAEDAALKGRPVVGLDEFLAAGWIVEEEARVAVGGQRVLPFALAVLGDRPSKL